MSTATQPKKPLTTRVKEKIAYLQQLIDHPRTSEDERDAGRRALQRIADNHEVTLRAAGGDSKGPGLLWNHGAWAGEKFWNVRHLTPTQIAKLIREDLKMARKVGRETAPKDGEIAISDPIGDAPREITFSVRTRHHTSIDVTIKNVPEGWGWTMKQDDWGNQVPIATPAMVALYRAAEEIHASYNYCNSDIQTDYFERNYWGSVSTEQHLRIPRD